MFPLRKSSPLSFPSTPSTSSRPRLWLVTAAFTLCLLTGATACDSGGSKTAAPAGTAEASPKSASVVAAQRKFMAKNVAGSGEVSVAIDGSVIRITAGDKEIVGEKDGSKRTYTRNGKFVAEVKADGAKFKLRDSSGKLLWKVKLKGDKIKISDNEEGENAYSIKDKGDGSYKVKRGEATIGKVKYYPKDKRFKVKDAAGARLYQGNAPKPMPMWGALLLTEIHENLRYIILAELGERG